MVWINLWLGKYHILSILDSLSSNPHVFLASHVKLQEYRVIKKISKTHPFFKQLKNEAEFLSAYSSEYIPKLYDVEEDADNLYLVEEYMEGVSLASETFLEGSLKENELVSIVTGLFDFLKFINSLEESVLYIDWKPDNIILTKTGVKIVDFGSVLFLEDNDNFTGLATDGFAAPELKKEGRLGSYTDVFGFGSVVRYLAGRTENKKSVFNMSVKDRLLKLSDKCTRENPGNRPDIKELERFIRKLKCKQRLALQTKQAGSIIRDITACRIGVCGVSNGVGTTHIALCVAKELAGLGRKVAYVSLAREGDTDVTFRGSPEGLKNVHICKGAYEEDIPYFQRKGYDNIIIDFGRMEEFSALYYSCDEKLIVIQNNFVKATDTEEFLINHQGEIGEKGWLVLDNLADETQLEATKAELKKLGFRTECKGIGIKRI